MASKKLVELDAIISRPQQMKALLHGLRCDCLTLTRPDQQRAAGLSPRHCRHCPFTRQSRKSRIG